MSASGHARSRERERGLSGACAPRTARPQPTGMYLRRPRKASFAIAAAHMRAWRSVLADVPEIDAERAQLAVQVRALHADALGELSHLAVTQQQLLLQVGALELLARFAQRQRQQILLHQRLIGRGLHRELALDFLQTDLFRTAMEQQPVH